ncbi:2Fe-2S ferredoxin [Tepidamorphus gemmatus]|uniref:2Fe-2S ferredoxin n=1 Tax=Tepidamorphus gemmatus TaxID=747076 RepID=A0A4R3M069_9HYPH|nr:2Fe-2S iron-sulfur cluster-binding protein [Tepidamorphus gemmatus]TCT06441.1 2Fe-2S ferredoxin [Tepidamorphus gemmatus]
MQIIVTDRDGREHVLEGLEGWRVMEVIRDWGLPMEAECGGAAICGKCHVRVAREWLDRLPDPQDDELDTLDKLDGVTSCSRLSCQILLTEELDGLRVELASEDAVAEAA